MRRICFCSSVILGALLLPGGAAAQERGEIRLTPLLSNLPFQAALARDASFVAVSARDGTVSVFDLNNEKASRDDDVFFSPIRDEEAEKERPLAVSPNGELIALGAPLERGKPDSARIYFFRHADKTRVIFSIDGLPSRPTALRFSSDRNDRRLRLAATFANRQAPRVWDVSEIQSLARDPARKVAPLDPPTVLPEPVPGFFSQCGRDANECHSWTAVFPPPLADRSDSGIDLVIGSDSGLVLYRDDFNGFKVLAYGHGQEQPDLRHVRSVSFSPDGAHFAVGRLAPPGDDVSACQVQVYDVKRLLADAANGPKLTQRPTVLRPPAFEGDETPTKGCNFAAVAWSGDSIFGAGLHVRIFDRSKCTTFMTLHEDYRKDEAVAMLQWQFPDTSNVRKICIGTNTVMDVQPFDAGGAVVATQDPFVKAYGPDGEISLYPGRARRERSFDGPILDLRDGERGDLTVSADASAVLLRPLRSPAAYLAFDLNQLSADPVSARALEIKAVPNVEVMGKLKQGLIDEIAARRKAALELSDKVGQPSQCFGVELPKGEAAYAVLDARAREQLKLRPNEQVRAVEFLPPGNPDGERRAVIGTSVRLIHADCAQRDLWHDGLLMRSLPSPGVPVRDDAYQVRVSKDRRFVVAAHGNGLLRWYRLSSGQLALSLFVHQYLGSWIAWTPEGYFDSSRNAGSGLAGWLRSIAKESGAWSIGAEPLANYEREWRRPDKLRQAILGTGDTSPADKAPNAGKPIITVSIPGHERVTTRDVPFRIVVQNFDGDPRSKLALYVERPGRISLDGARSFPEKDYWVVAGTFALDDCLQKKGQSARVWVQWDGLEVPRSDDAFVYDGSPSSAKCPPQRVWGIFVGISDYASEPLRYAHQDAERFFKFWNTHPFYERRRLVLLSAPPKDPATLTVVVNGKPQEPQPAAPDAAWKAQATRRLLANELHAMKDETDGLGSSDLLVIYLAGHGVSHREGDRDRWSFMPSDGDINNRQTLLDAEWLSGELANMNKASSILLLVDACRNYAKSYRDGVQGAPVSQLLELSKTHNAAVLVGAATGAASFEFPKSDLMRPAHPQTCQQSAGEDNEGGGGAFTYALLHLLESGPREEDGSIRVGKLAEGLYDEVQKICRLQEVAYGPSIRSFQRLFRRQ